MTPVRPPKAAQRLAAHALEIRALLPKTRRGGLEPRDAAAQGIISGVTRAQSIARGEIQPDAERIVAFFRRFERRIEADIEAGKDLTQSKVLQAAALWGGEPMRRSAFKAVRKHSCCDDCAMGHVCPGEKSCPA